MAQVTQLFSRPEAVDLIDKVIELSPVHRITSKEIRGTRCWFSALPLQLAQNQHDFADVKPPLHTILDSIFISKKTSPKGVDDPDLNVVKPMSKSSVSSGVVSLVS